MQGAIAIEITRDLLNMTLLSGTGHHRMPEKKSSRPLSDSENQHNKDIHCEINVENGVHLCLNELSAHMKVTVLLQT